MRPYAREATRANDRHRGGQCCSFSAVVLSNYATISARSSGTFNQVAAAIPLNDCGQQLMLQVNQ